MPRYDRKEYLLLLQEFFASEEELYKKGEIACPRYGAASFRRWLRRRSGKPFSPFVCESLPSETWIGKTFREEIALQKASLTERDLIRLPIDWAEIENRLSQFAQTVADPTQMTIGTFLGWLEKESDYQGYVPKASTLYGHLHQKKEKKDPVEKKVDEKPKRDYRERGITWP